MSRSRTHSLMVSLDGYAAGLNLGLETPIGGAERLFDLFDERVIHGVDRAKNAPITVDRALISTWGQGVGADIMGRRMFCPYAGPWEDDEWRGWWGEDPPFHTPVFVWTHYPRRPIVFDNGTSFQFVQGTGKEVLACAREAAGGLDVRIDGGPATIREFLEDDLIDFMHVVVVPITLGRGHSLLNGIEGVERRFEIETVTSTSGLTHQLWNRLDRTSSDAGSSPETQDAASEDPTRLPGLSNDASWLG